MVATAGEAISSTREAESLDKGYGKRGRDKEAKEDNAG